MEKLSKKQPINQLKEGDKVNDIFVVKIKKTIVPYVKGYCFTLILSDSSGSSIDYKYWGSQNEDKVKALLDSFAQDSVIHVTGTVSMYKGKLQVSANESDMLRVLKEGEYDAVFIRGSKKDVEQMYAQLMEKIGSIADNSLKELLFGVFNGDFRDKFKKHPGAIQIHHNWIGGLLQHTLEVVEFCETCVKLNPELDRDLLLTGAMLHDIGKLEELEMTSRIKGSRKGQFLGHISLGSFFVFDLLQEYDMDALLKEKLMHLMVSHHGRLEFGSSKEPMIPEAVALYYSDELSSKLSEMIEFIIENKASTEDEFKYHVKKGHNLFLR